jgi:hypothetical protein
MIKLSETCKDKLKNKFKELVYVALSFGTETTEFITATTELLGIVDTETWLTFSTEQINKLMINYCSYSSTLVNCKNPSEIEEIFKWIFLNLEGIING